MCYSMVCEMRDYLLPKTQVRKTFDYIYFSVTQLNFISRSNPLGWPKHNLCQFRVFLHGVFLSSMKTYVEPRFWGMVWHLVCCCLSLLTDAEMCILSHLTPQQCSMQISDDHPWLLLHFPQILWISLMCLHHSSDTGDYWVTLPFGSYFSSILTQDAFKIGGHGIVMGILVICRHLPRKQVFFSLRPSKMICSLFFLSLNSALNGGFFSNALICSPYNSLPLPNPGNFYLGVHIRKFPVVYKLLKLKSQTSSVCICYLYSAVPLVLWSKVSKTHQVKKGFNQPSQNTGNITKC